MPHADSALVPPNLERREFWVHVHTQLESLLSGQRHWVTNLANASSLIYSSLAAYKPHFGDGENAVNWCGFYVETSFFPKARVSPKSPDQDNNASLDQRLLLGPFCGKPACQFINVTPGKSRGVCADAYLQRKTMLVPDVEAYPGHIACDGETKSEIVCPLLLKQNGESIAVGVLDLDCLALKGFSLDDMVGLERIADLVVNSCDW